MKINRNSWMVWIIQSIFNISIFDSFDRNEPSYKTKGKISADLCGFSKKLMLALILAPFCWLSIIIQLIFNRKDPGDSMPSWFTPIINLISLGLYHGLYKIEHVTISSALIGIFIGSIVLVLSFITIAYAIAGIVYCFNFVEDKIKKYIRNRRLNKNKVFIDPLFKKERKPNIITTYIKSVKEKYCPKIEFI